MRYQSKRPKRQFVAGVTCRACQALDTTVQVRTFEPDDEYIECTACGHTERRPTPKDATTMRTQDGFDSENAGVVKFIP